MFYCYTYLRVDGTPYYVGKATGLKRPFKQDGHNVRVPDRNRIIVQQYESEEDALAAECFLIAFYGRVDLGTGILRNFTNGGEGMSGWKASPETRCRQRLAKLGRVGPRLGSPQSLDTRRRIAQSLTGKVQSKEHIENRERSMKDIRLTEEYRQKMREAASRRWKLGA